MKNGRGVSRNVVGLAAAMILAAVAQPAAARDFSAERIVKSGKTTVTAHVNAKDDRW